MHSLSEPLVLQDGSITCSRGPTSSIELPLPGRRSTAIRNFAALARLDEKPRLFSGKWHRAEGFLYCRLTRRFLQEDLLTRHHVLENVKMVYLALLGEIRDKLIRCAVQIVRYPF